MPLSESEEDDELFERSGGLFKEPGGCGCGDGCGIRQPCVSP